jgi:hypothetical protein
MLAPRDIKLGEEGNIANSLAILTSIPEVNLGLECVSNTTPLSLSL